MSCSVYCTRNSHYQQDRYTCLLLFLTVHLCCQCYFFRLPLTYPCTVCYCIRFAKNQHIIIDSKDRGQERYVGVNSDGSLVNDHHVFSCCFLSSASSGVITSISQSEVGCRMFLSISGMSVVQQFCYCLCGIFIDIMRACFDFQCFVFVCFRYGSGCQKETN